MKKSSGAGPLLQALFGIGLGLAALIAPAPSTAQNLGDNIVRVRTPDTETGTGMVIGTEGARLYVLTARHVVKDFINDEVTIFARQSPDLSFVAKVLDLDDSSKAGALDLAVLEIDLEAAANADNGPFLAPRVFLRTVTGRSRVLDCDIGEAVRAIGHAAGSFNQHVIPTTIQSRRYDNEKAFFTIGSSSIEGGISGSPLFNSNDEFIGVIVEIGGDRKTAKVVALSSIREFLRRHSVARNLLAEAPMVGFWTLADVTLPGRGPVKTPSNWTLKLGNDGKASDLVNGRYCLRDKEALRFRVSGIPTSIAIPAGSNIQTSRAISDNERCKLHVARGFNFTNTSEQPTSSAQTQSAQPSRSDISTAQGMALTLHCQGNFGPVSYSFINKRI